MEEWAILATSADDPIMVCLLHIGRSSFGIPPIGSLKGWDIVSMCGPSPHIASIVLADKSLLISPPVEATMVRAVGRGSVAEAVPSTVASGADSCP